MTFTRDGDPGRTAAHLSVVEGPTIIRGLAEDEDLSVEERALRTRLSELRQEHRDLDRTIEAIVSAAEGDQLQLSRMKKRKLLLRDLIKRIEDELTPDIIA